MSQGPQWGLPRDHLIWFGAVLRTDRKGTRSISRETCRKALWELGEGAAGLGGVGVEM